MWPAFRSRALRRPLSIVLACCRQLAHTNGTRGGGPPPRVVRSTNLEPAPCNGRAPAAKPATRAVVVDRQGSFAAPFWSLPFCKRVRSRGQTCHPGVGSLPASQATCLFGYEMSMHRTERMFGVEASERLRRAMMRNFFCVWAPGARFEGLCASGASGVLRPNLPPRCRQLASVRSTMSSVPLATGTLPRPNLPPCVGSLPASRATCLFC
jgi:hypothetical protein